MTRRLIFFATIVFQTFLYSFGRCQAVECELHTAQYYTDYYSCNYDPFILAFEDEFDMLDIDKLIWYNKYGWSNFLIQNNEQAVYTDNNYEVENGLINLFARNEQVWDTVYPYFPLNVILDDGLPNYRQFDYTSGLIFSKRVFGYGKYEIRCRLPKGKGYWPAFWTYGGGEGPFGNDYNEIDIFEFWNEQDIFNNYDASKLSRIPHMNTHHNFYQLSNPDQDYSCGAHFEPGADFSQNFHVFTMIFEPLKIEWYIDGQIFHTRYLFYTGGALANPVNCDDYSNVNQGPGYRMNKSFPKFPGGHIIANLAIQSGSNSPDGSNNLTDQFEIDYVRYYKKVECVDEFQDYSSNNLALDDEKFNFIAGDHVKFSSLTIEPHYDVNWVYHQGQLSVSALSDITFDEGFEVEEGSELVAKIDGYIYSCPNSGKVMGNEVNIEELESKIDSNVFEVLISPNPTNGQIKVLINEEYESVISYEYSLLSIEGQPLSNGQVSNGTVLNLQNLNEGSYLFRLINPSTGECLIKKICLVK